MTFSIILFGLICFTFSSCAPKQSNEMETIGEDVLRAKRGLQIEIQPMPQAQEATKNKPSRR